MQKPLQKPLLKLFRRGALLLVALLMGLGVAIYLGRFWLAEQAIRQALEQRGFENVSLTVTNLSQKGIRVKNLHAGPQATLPGLDQSLPSLAIEQIEIKATWPEIRDGVITAIYLKNAQVEITRPSNEWLIGNVPVSRLRGTSSGDSPRFKVNIVSLKSVNASINSCSGDVRFILDGDYDLAKGGNFLAQLTSDSLLYGNYDARNTATRLQMSLDPSGAFNGMLTARTSIATTEETYPALDLKAAFDGPSWQAFLRDPKTSQFNADIAFDAPILPLAGLEKMQPTLNFFTGGNPAKAASISIRTSITYENNTLVLRHSPQQDETRLISGKNSPSFATLALDNGASAVLSTLPERNILRLSDDQVILDLAYQLEGIKAAPASGQLSVSRSEKAPFQVRFSMSGAQWHDKRFDLIPGKINFDGTLDKTRLAGKVDFNGGAARIDTNNATLRNFLTNGAFQIEANFQTNTLTLATTTDCIDLAKPYIKMKAGTFRLGNARLCAPNAAPVVFTATRRPGEGLRIKANGILRAATLNADIGETLLTGVPPTAKVEIEYHKDKLTAKARLTGSKLNFDQRILFTDTAATGVATYRDGALIFNGDISKLMISDLTRPVKFSPLAFNGNLQLRDSQASFIGKLLTPEGEPLADADGRYNLQVGKGNAALTFGPVFFIPQDLQPASIAPALKGLFENADGQAGGVIKFNWADGRVQTSGAFNVTNLTFNGPVRQVTQTGGLEGDLVFSQIRPLKTDGVQQATVRLVDLDALQLENGIVQYEFPGDNTIRVLSAIWPWFSGELEIADAIIPLDREKVTVPLQIRNINLAELLDYFDVDGLSGSGRLEGSLPIVFEDGKARIENGRLAAIGTGTLKYESDSLDAAAKAAGAAGRIAFEALADYRFEELVLTINGDLTGDVDFTLKMNGRTDSEIASRGLVYNINIKAPLFGLIEQFRANQRGEDFLVDQLSKKAGVKLIFDNPEVSKADAPSMPAKEK